MDGFLNREGKDIVEGMIRVIQQNKAYTCRTSTG